MSVEMKNRETHERMIDLLTSAPDVLLLILNLHKLFPCYLILL